MSPHQELPAAVAVLGAGSWGTTFAKVVADAHPGIHVRLWARRPEVVEEINSRHLNSQYLNDIRLPDNLTASGDVADVMDGSAEPRSVALYNDEQAVGIDIVKS
ncbi:MAG TPA: hypothetical protein VHH13_10765, partial [Arthrobacter sp.]|nr:hypothetical protein [Arthrobacter sp.]